VEFYNIDVDENPDLAREYRIMNIPAVIAIKGGQVAGQQIGLVSKDDMKGFIDGVF
jgi:thioredoxin 1